MEKLVIVISLFCAVRASQGVTLKDGSLYTFKSEFDSQVLTVKGKSYDAGTKIGLDTSHDDSTQQWLAVLKDDKFIFLTKHQKWDWSKVISTGGSKKLLEDLPSETLALTVNTKKSKNPVTLEFADGKSHQLWKSVKAGSGGGVLLQNVATDSCLVNPSGGKSKKGIFGKIGGMLKSAINEKSHAKMHECDENDEHQRWVLIRVGSD